MKQLIIIAAVIGLFSCSKEATTKIGKTQILSKKTKEEKIRRYIENHNTVNYTEALVESNDEPRKDNRYLKEQILSSTSEGL